MRLGSLCTTVGTLATVLVLALAALTGPAQASGDPLSGAPSVGECYAVSGAAAAKSSLSSSPTACTTQHTLWVYAVGQPKASYNLSKAAGRAKAYAAVCTTTALQSAIGSAGANFGMSAYTRYNFAPTSSQISAGAHWVSCTLGITAGTNKLVKSSDVALTSIKSSVPNKVRLCGSVHYHRIACTLTHSYRSTYAVVVHSAPSDDAAWAKSATVCKKKVKSKKWMYSWTALTSKSYALACLGHNSK